MGHSTCASLFVGLLHMLSCHCIGQLYIIRCILAAFWVWLSVIDRPLAFCNPIAFRTAKTLWSFGCSESNRVKPIQWNIPMMVASLHHHFFPQICQNIVRRYVKENILFFLNTHSTLHSQEFVTSFLLSTG